MSCAPSPIDRARLAEQQPQADRAEQQHLGERLAELDQALQAEDPLQSAERIELVALERERAAAKAERAEHGGRADRGEQGQSRTGRATAARRSRAAAASALPGSKSRRLAASKLEPLADHVLQRAHHHRPRQRDPAGADQHDQSGAELARLEDVAILRRVAPAFRGRRLGSLVLVGLVRHLSRRPRSGAIARGRD